MTQGASYIHTYIHSHIHARHGLTTQSDGHMKHASRGPSMGEQRSLPLSITRANMAHAQATQETRV